MPKTKTIDRLLPEITIECPILLLCWPMMNGLVWPIICYSLRYIRNFPKMKCKKADFFGFFFDLINSSRLKANDEKIKNSRSNAI